MATHSSILAWRIPWTEATEHARKEFIEEEASSQLEVSDSLPRQ